MNERDTLLEWIRAWLAVVREAVVLEAKKITASLNVPKELLGETS